MNNYTPFVALWLAAVSLSSKSSIVQAQTFETCVSPNVATGAIGPTQTVYENLCGTAAPTTTFTEFCAIINRSGFEDYVTYLSSVGRITVFAPIDGAFTPPLPTTTEDLQQLIELHIVAEALTLDGLICDDVISTIGFNSDPQLQKTRCLTGGQPYQIGGGNKGRENWPQIGTSTSLVFSSAAFTDPITPFNTNDAGATFLTGSNIVSCNGIIQVVDKLLRPVEDSGSKSGKSDKGGKGSKSSSDDFRRELETDYDNDSDNKRSSDSLQRRKRRLEALLEPNGNIEQLN